MTISIKKLKEVSLQTESKKHRALVNLGRGNIYTPDYNRFGLTGKKILRGIYSHKAREFQALYLNQQINCRQVLKSFIYSLPMAFKIASPQ